ncbi:MAG TPA: alanine--tRNA ligase [Pantanalinema sp.]
MSLSGHEIRAKYIEFFKRKGHAHLPSSSLVPKNDPTVLLTTAGMLQFKPIFMGVEAAPNPPKAVTVQKCFRTTDLDNVGRTARHHTFFQMLGNFSFGDYFKAEAIAYAWEFLTVDLALPKDRLWVSVFETDDEALAIWRDTIGVPADRIVRMGEEDNFWAAGPTGPCGPCSEIYFDQGVSAGNGNPDAILGEDDDRYLEIWNLVFMQYNRDETGTLTPLPAQNIDTGMGLERIASVIQGVPTNYDTDLVKPIILKAAELAGVTYGADKEKDVSLKVIADHIRGAVFLIGDGVVPSNEGRGYVLRRIMRRAIRHAKLLGMQRPFLAELGELIISHYAYYPELSAQKEFILQSLSAEETRFSQTIDRGSQLLANAFDTFGADNKVIPGETAFELYDTYGFPFELTVELAAEKGFSVDETGFHAAMELQRERARKAREEAGVTFSAVDLKTKEATPFKGYASTQESAEVREVFTDKSGRTGVVLDHTPFYAESGGQVGDQGVLGTTRVVDTQKMGPTIVHLLEAGSEAPSVGDRVEAKVDLALREATMRHHTATHLLHAALKQVLGPQVNQAGSLVGPEELRFDFTFARAMTPEEIAKVEDLVNAEVFANRTVAHIEMSLADAQASGAMALFGEKYGETVRVIDVPGFSKELCGGTHVRATGTIGTFKVVREEGIAAGIRRVTAVAGTAALAYFRSQAEAIAAAGTLLKASAEDLPERIEKLQDRVKATEAEVRALKSRLAIAQTESLLEGAIAVGSYRLIAAVVPNMAPDAIKGAVEHLRDKLKSGVVVLGSVEDGKLAMVAAASDDLVKEGAHAGKLIGSLMGLVGGKGGGKPQIAQGGGGEPGKLNEAIAQVSALVAQQIPVNA